MYLEATEIFERLGYFTSRITVSLFLLSLSFSKLERESRAVGVFFLKVTKERRWISFCFFFFFLSERHRCLRWRNVFQSLSLEFEESKINGALKRVIYLYITRKYVAFDSRSDNARIWHSGDKIFHPGNKRPGLIISLPMEFLLNSVWWGTCVSEKRWKRRLRADVEIRYFSAQKLKRRH